MQKNNSSKPEKNVSCFTDRYAEHTGDLLTVTGVQGLHIYVSFFKLVLNIQSVGAGGESYQTLKIFFKLKVSCQMEAIICTISEVSHFNFQILF